jgi:hypothetical protein
MFTRSVILFWLYTTNILLPLVHVHADAGLHDDHRQLDVVTPLDGPCQIIACDFSTLQVASYMSNEAQIQKILQDYGIISISANDGNGKPRNVNVFDSSDIKGRKFDPDLGSPNRRCPDKGPGRGRGGGPKTDFPNCVPQDNLLIIQNTNYDESTPNYSPNGGCMYIEFEKEVTLFDMGLLDMEEPITITVRFASCS